jgi:hypothetical protein
LSRRNMVLSSALVTLLTGILLRTHISPASHGVRAWSSGDLPSQAQVISQKAFNVLGSVPPPTGANGSSVSA